MKVKAEGDVKPEVVAAIAAAVQQMTKGVVAVKIKRAEIWTILSRRL